ncbi:MAG: hypothetical protein A3B88_01515 [Candidatus Zambryskibacteria bacterium RIFCSPHIGHO2_02_FULL_39_19]|nr:MAG: hypothetical protein A3B88_01515 [Candidatus Zambryskibacteria bacterium RIFCSPHIGHO2_02_FULL_39_19]
MVPASYLIRQSLSGGDPNLRYPLRMKLRRVKESFGLAKQIANIEYVVMKYRSDNEGTKYAIMKYGQHLQFLKY